MKTWKKDINFYNGVEYWIHSKKGIMIHEPTTTTENYNLDYFTTEELRQFKLKGIKWIVFVTAISGKQLHVAKFKTKREAEKAVVQFKKRYR